MARLLVFVVFFIIFMVLKGILLGAKKIVGVGSEAFDAVYGTDTSNIREVFSEKTYSVKESIIGLLTVVAHANDTLLGELNEDKASIVNYTIDQLASDETNRELAKDILLSVYKEVGNKILNSSNLRCFYDENIKKKIKIFSKTINSNLSFQKETILKQLIALGDDKYLFDQCQKKIIYYIGKKFGYSKDYVKSIMDSLYHDGTNEKQSYSNDQNTKDPYQILGVSKDDSLDVIKQKYKELVRKFHPDFIEGKGLDEEFLKFANEKLKGINWAFEKIKKERGM